MVTTTAAPLTVSRQSWAKSLLQRLGASQSPTTINAVVAWEAAKGGAGPQFGVRNNVTTYNPLNVTLTYGSKGYGQTPGSSAFYWVPRRPLATHRQWQRSSRGHRA